MSPIRLPRSTLDWLFVLLGVVAPLMAPAFFCIQFCDGLTALNGAK